MKGCGFGQVSLEEYYRQVVKTFDEMPVEEREAVRKKLPSYAELERKARAATTSLRQVK